MISFKEIEEIDKEMNDFLERGYSYFDYLEKRFRSNNLLMVKIIEEVQSQINVKRMQPTLSVFYFFLYFLRLLEKSLEKEKSAKDVYINEEVAVQTIRQISSRILNNFETVRKEIIDLFLKNQIIKYMFQRFVDKECKNEEERSQVLITAFIIYKIFLNQKHKEGII